MQEEIWKDIPGWEGFYQVSTLGRVKSLSRKLSNGKGIYTSKEKLLKENILHKGYHQVYLKRDNKRAACLLVHRLVADAFIPNPQCMPQVNHINGNKQDNRLENLEWTDNRGNQLHAYRTGLQKPHNCWKGRIGRRCALLAPDGSIEKVYDTLAAAARDFGEKTGSNLGHHLKGVMPHFHGRIFKCL